MSVTSRLVLIAWLALLSTPTPAETYVNRIGPGGAVQDATFTQSRTWNAAGSPYILEGHVTVAEGVTLKIESGSVVRVSAGRGLYVNGTLTADRASFTINGTGSDNWLGLYLAPTSGASTLEGCTLERAGAPNLGYFHNAYRAAALYVDRCAPTVSNTLVKGSAGQGIELFESSGTFRQNTFENLADGAYAFVLDTLNLFPVLAGNQANGTGIPGIYFPGGAISGLNTWNNPGTGLAYYLGGDVTVAEEAKLTVEAGVVVKSRAKRMLVQGTMIVNGTAQAPVLFTSSAATPVAGDWFGIYFGPAASASTFNHVTLCQAGASSLVYAHGAYRSATVYVDGSSPAFDHVTISGSASSGLDLYGSKATVSNSTFSACGGHALRAEAGSRPTVAQCTFLGNGSNEEGYYTIATDASSVPTPSGNTFKNNQRQGVQIWGGTLPASATWKVWSPNAPYVITADLSLGEEETLTIESGATIKIQGAGLYIYGTLTADGGTNRIGFTSWSDDTLAGDSNGDEARTLSAPGDWKGIYLSQNSGRSLMNNCLVRYAGRNNIGYLHNAYRAAALYVDTCSPTITQSTFQDSAANGIELWSSHAVVRDSQFLNVAPGSYPIVNDTLDTALFASGNSFSGSGEPGIFIPGGTISESVTWPKPGGDLVYLINGELIVAEGATLTVAPGVIIKTLNQRILIYGTLNAQGTAAEPILVTSRSAAPAPGDWAGIYFSATAGGSVLRHAQFAYGGATLSYTHNSYRFATLYLDSCSPTLDHVLVANSAHNGVELWSSQASLADSIIRDCGGHGLRAEAFSRPALKTVLFSGNGTNSPGVYTIALDANSVPTPQNVTFSNNQWQAIQIWGGTLPADAQWRTWAANAPYVVTDDVNVAPNVTLTVEPGTVVKFAGRGLYVRGTLIANGADDPITFTSSLDDTAGGDSNGDGATNTPAGGNWTGIYLNSDAGNSVLDNCRFFYAGGNNIGYIHNAYRFCALYVDDCSPVISNCVFANSASHGIELWSSAASITRSSFRNFGSLELPGYCIVLDTLDDFPTLAENNLQGLGYGGIHVPGGTIPQSAAWNRPGDNFPYLLNGDVTIAESATLRLDPGVEVRADSAGLYAVGTLTALGSPSLPIVLSSRRAERNPGDWKGLYLGPASGHSALRFVKIAYAGMNIGYMHNNYRFASLYVDGCDPALDNLTVSQGSANGVELYASSAALRSSLLVSNMGHGVLLHGNTQPHLINNTVVKSSLSGIYAVDCSPTLANNIIVKNGNYGIRRDTGTLTLANNLLYENTWENYWNTAPGPLDLSADPHFVDFAAGDYHLAAASPAVDAGANASLTAVDLDGQPRVAGLSVDLGAYESGSSGGAVPVITSALAAAGQVGVSFTYQITATHEPTGYSATTLDGPVQFQGPGGLNVNRVTGLITGVPLTSGTNHIQLLAENGAGRTMATLTLTIAPRASKTLYDNGNIAAVQNGPTAPTTFTLAQPIVLTAIRDYHYFNHGALPGTITLRHADGTDYGPWQTTGLTGQGGVPNAYWQAQPNAVLKAGTYTVIDSDPSTWSHNAGSGFAGFTSLEGYEIAAETRLSITRTPNGLLSVQWSSPTGVLEETTHVTSQTWSLVATEPAAPDGQYTVLINPTNSMRFYRLKNP